MQYHIILIAYIAAVVTASAPILSATEDNKPQNEAPIPLPYVSVPSVEESGHSSPSQSVGKSGVVASSAADVRTTTASYPKVTVAGKTIDQAEWLKFVPSPSPMPTATLHYGTDLGAKLSSDMASSAVKHFDPSISSSALLAEISSLEQAAASASAALFSLSKASMTESANRAEATKELEKAKHEYKGLHNAGSLVIPSLSMTTSLVVAIFFAGVAFVL